MLLYPTSFYGYHCNQNMHCVREIILTSNIVFIFFKNAIGNDLEDDHDPDYVERTSYIRDHDDDDGDSVGDDDDGDIVRDDDVDEIDQDGQDDNHVNHHEDDLDYDLGGAS